MTRSELLAELKQVLRETAYDAAWGDTLLLRYLAEGQDKLCEETGFFVDAQNYTVATQAGVASYALTSTRIISVLDVFDADGTRLQHFNEEDRYLDRGLDRSSYQVRPRTATLVTSGTAQAGTTSTVTLAATSSASNDAYNGMTIKFTGALPSGILGQQHVIADYDGTTKVATLYGTLSVAPTSESEYVIEQVVESDTGQVGYWQADYENGFIKLLPTPNTTQTLTLRVWRYSRTALDATGGEPEIPVQFQRACVEYAAYKAMMHHDMEQQDKVKASDHYTAFKLYCAEGKKAKRRHRSEETVFRPSPVYNWGGY